MYVISEEQLVSDGGRTIDVWKTRVPIKIWSSPGSIEESAIKQITNAANLPFAFHHIALCPDAHSGYGVPIGAVVALDKVISPHIVGSDIGCGMCAIKTSLKIEELDIVTLKKIMGEIRNVIPVGPLHNKYAASGDKIPHLIPNETPIVEREYMSALKQVNSLGQGNHFLEIQKGSDGYIWVMIHSGSRNVGYTVADHYNKVAIALNEKWYSSVPKEHQLAFLPLDSGEGQMYFKEMQWCVDFALCNRKLMMENVSKIFADVTQCTFEPLINIAHNYARMENHFGHNVMIHRKGATSAKEGEVGLIPGSQGTCSYIVKGKGNIESFMSCSHGAGRKMGRKEACRSLNLQEEIKRLDDKGIVHSIRNNEDLDEAAGAYKSIDIVMEEQKDLVEILVKLEPLAVIKG